MNKNLLEALIPEIKVKIKQGRSDLKFFACLPRNTPIITPTVIAAL